MYTKKKYVEHMEIFDKVPSFFIALTQTLYYIKVETKWFLTDS